MALVLLAGGAVALFLAQAGHIAGQDATAGLGDQLDRIIATVPPISTDGTEVSPLASAAAVPSPIAPAGETAACATARHAVLARVLAPHPAEALTEAQYGRDVAALARTCPAEDVRAVELWAATRIAADQGASPAVPTLGLTGSAAP